MTYTVIPALDIVGGTVARAGLELLDPVQVAQEWEQLGVEWIHLADLDLAYGRGENSAVIRRVIAGVDVAVQLSGGLRTRPAIEAALTLPCQRINVAAEVLADPDLCRGLLREHGERLAFCLDAAVEGAGYVLRPRGGGFVGTLPGLEPTLGWLTEAGCRAVVVTDVARDGALTGPNLGLLKHVQALTAAEVIASGGVRDLADLEAISGVGACAAIVGAALHTGQFTLAEALNCVRDHAEISGEADISHIA